MEGWGQLGSGLTRHGLPNPMANASTRGTCATKCCRMCEIHSNVEKVHQRNLSPNGMCLAAGCTAKRECAHPTPYHTRELKKIYGGVVIILPSILRVDLLMFHLVHGYLLRALIKEDEPSG